MSRSKPCRVPGLGRTLPGHTAPGRSHQAGSAMVEFVVVGPVITLLGLALLQYGLLFFAKNGFNHAAFMAARAGSVGNASLDSVREAYARALIPLYGGGRDSAELTQAYARAQADVAGNVRIELLNPTKQSFDDWNDPALQQALGQGRRVIPNANLAFKNPQEVRPASGQSIHDANLIKLRFTQGYEPKVPLVRSVYALALRQMDSHTDAFHTQLVQAGRIPVVTQVTLQMQSDAIEPEQPVSLPSGGAQPGDSGAPPAGGPPAGGADAGGTAPSNLPGEPGPADPGFVEIPPLCAAAPGA